MRMKNLDIDGFWFYFIGYIYKPKCNDIIEISDFVLIHPLQNVLKRITNRDSFKVLAY